MSYLIKSCGPEEHQAVLALHQKAFEPLAGEKYTHSKEEFLKNIAAGRVLVARSVLEDDVLAFAGYKPLAVDPNLKIAVDYWIQWSSNKENEGDLREQMTQERQQLGIGDIIAEIYDNEYTRAARPLQLNDIYLSEIVVREDQRRHGLGEALTRRQIEIARAEDALAMYASCWEGGYSSTLLEKMGFLPLVKAGPRYADGQAEKVMCLWLK